MRAGVAKVVMDAHKRVLARVREGAATADGLPTGARSVWHAACLHTPTRLRRAHSACASSARLRSYGYEAVCALYAGLVPALLAGGELDTLREFLANSLTGALLTDDAMRAGVLGIYTPGAVFGWRSDDGHYHVLPLTLLCSWCTGCMRCSRRTPTRAAPRCASGYRRPPELLACASPSTSARCVLSPCGCRPPGAAVRAAAR